MQKPVQNQSFLRNRNNPVTDNKIEIMMIPKNAKLEFSRKLGTFIPYKLAIRVGIINKIEIDVSRFITMLRLFDITDAKASIIPL